MGTSHQKDPDVVAHIDAIWDELAIFNKVKAPDARLFCPIYRSDRESDDNLKL